VLFINSLVVMFDVIRTVLFHSIVYLESEGAEHPSSFQEFLTALVKLY